MSFRLPNIPETLSAQILASPNAALLDGSTVRFRNSSNNVVLQFSPGDNLLKRGPMATPAVSSYDPNTIFVLTAVPNSINAYCISPLNAPQTPLFITGKKKDNDNDIKAENPDKWEATDKTMLFEFQPSLWGETNGDKTLAVKIHAIMDKTNENQERYWNVSADSVKTNQVYGNQNNASILLVDVVTAGSSLATIDKTVPPTSAAVLESSANVATDKDDGGGFPFWGWILIILGIIVFLGIVYYMMSNHREEP